MNTATDITYRVTITGSGKRFTAALAKIKTLAGGRYEPSEKAWYVTLDPADSYRFEVLTSNYDVTAEEV